MECPIAPGSTRVARKPATHHSHRGDTAGYALPHAACTFAGPQGPPADTWKGPVWGLPICNCLLSSPPRRIQAACQPVPSRHTRVRPMRTLQKHPEELPTGLSFCTKVDGFDPSKRVVVLQGIQRLQLPVKPPGAAGRACRDNE